MGMREIRLMRKDADDWNVKERARVEKDGAEFTSHLLNFDSGGWELMSGLILEHQKGGEWQVLLPFIGEPAWPTMLSELKNIDSRAWYLARKILDADDLTVCD